MRRPPARVQATFLPTENDQTMPDILPVTLLTGFLGSGKTTVLNHLMQQPALRDALVIINEFGEIPLDHLLVAHSTENLIVPLASGCLCCTIREDLVSTLQAVRTAHLQDGHCTLRRVVIETTGLADPVPIVHTLLRHADIAPHFALDGIIVTADLASAADTLDQHAEAVKQVAMADSLLLTKADLCTPEQIAAVQARLRAINPAAPLHLVRNGEVPAPAVLDLGPGRDSPADAVRWLREAAYVPRAASCVAAPVASARQPHGHHDERIHAFCFATDQSVGEQALEGWLQMLASFMGSNILRMKGILNIEGRPAPVLVQGVQHIFHPPVALPAWPDADRRSRLVFITRDIGRETIESTFRAFLKPASRS